MSPKKKLGANRAKPKTSISKVAVARSTTTSPRFTATTGSRTKLGGGVLAYFCFEEKRPSGAFLRDLNSATGGAVLSVYESGEFTATAGAHITFRRPSGFDVESVILVGLGDRKKMSLDNYRQGAGMLSRLSGVKKAPVVSLDGEGEITPEIAQAVVEGYELGRWRMTDYKTDKKSKEEATSSPAPVIVTSTTRARDKAQRGIERGHIVAQAVGLCRRLANQPSNVLTPAVFAEEGSTFTLALRYDRVDLDGDRGEALEPGLNFRPFSDTVFKLSYRFGLESLGVRNVPGRDSFEDDGFIFSLSTYF